MYYPVILSRVGILATKDSLFQEMKEDGKMPQWKARHGTGKHRK